MEVFQTDLYSLFYHGIRIHCSRFGRQEAEWLRNLLADMPLWGRQASQVSLHCDSQAAIGIAKNSVYNGKKRHIHIRHGAVKQLLKLSVISLDYVRSERNLADPMTK